MNEKLSYQQQVLVVDDDVDLAEITADCLSDFGLVVQTVFTIPQAKEKLSEKKYDYVITDLTMPDGGGLELISWVKTKSSEEDLGIVIASGQLSFEIDALNGVAVEWLPKPFSKLQLKEVCDKMKRFQRGNTG